MGSIARVQVDGLLDGDDDGEEQPSDRAERDEARAALWQRHEQERRAAALSEDEKEAEGDELLARHGHGGHYVDSRRTISRRRAREIPISQLEAPSYSGTRHLLRSMAEALQLADAEEHWGLAEWSVRRDVVHAIRAETALTVLEKETLLGRIRGEPLRELAERLHVSHEHVRKLLAVALEKYYAGKLPRLEAASAAAACFYEDASRRAYQDPNCCGQSPLCLDDADSKPCAHYEHERPEGLAGQDVWPGDLSYCPLADLPRWLWGRR